MTDTPPPTDRSGDGDGEQPIRLLHVDPEAAVRERVGALAEEVAAPFEVVGVEAPAGAAGTAPDCVVADPFAPGAAWAALTEVVPDDVPVVLYTHTDPSDVPAEVADAADTLVQKGNGEEGRRFLLEKARWATDAADPGLEVTGEVDARALATERAEARGVYLLAADGAVLWASTPLADLFPTDRDAVDPETANLYDRLAVALAEAPSLLGDVVDLQGTDEALPAKLLPVPARGRTRYLLHSSYPVPEGARAARVAVFEDLTEAYRSRERRDLLERMVNSAQDGIYTLNANGRLGYVNRAMAEILGYAREDLEGKHASAVMAPGELKHGQEAIQRMLSDPEVDSIVHDMTFVTTDGEEVEVALHVTPLYGPDGDYAGILGVMRTITERKRREEELERYETIVQALGDPVYAVDGDGSFIYVNEAFEAATGYEAADVVGRPARLILDEEDGDRTHRRVLELIDSDGTDTATFEVTVQCADGDSFPAELNLTLLPRDGQYRGNAGVIRDITERKAREKRLEEFTSVVAHDLRSPISVGEGNLDLYRETGEEERLDRVGDALARMEELVEDLLELARQGQAIGETEPVEVSRAVAESWDRAPTTAATLELAEGLGTVRADRERLHQLLRNLFRNAVDHAGEAPTVTVGPLGGSRAEGRETGFYVADDGPGVPEADRERVFERGYSEAEGGTGFGLAIVDEIAAAHDWGVDVTESASGGARFEVRVPDQPPG